MHQINDRIYCACAPSVAVIEADSFVIRHNDFALRNVARIRRIYEP